MMDILLLKLIKQTILVDLFMFVYIKTTIYKFQNIYATFTDKMKTNAFLLFIPVKLQMQL